MFSSLFFGFFSSVHLALFAFVPYGGVYECFMCFAKLMNSVYVCVGYVAARVVNVVGHGNDDGVLLLLRRKLLYSQINTVAAQQRRCSIQTGKSSIFTFSIALDWQETTDLSTSIQHTRRRKHVSVGEFFPPLSILSSGSWQSNGTTAVSNHICLSVCACLCCLCFNVFLRFNLLVPLCFVFMVL